MKKFVISQKHHKLQINLSEYMKSLVENINKILFESIYTDYIRAFASVNIDLLLRKLSAYGMSDFLFFFLSDRIL